MVGPHEDVRAHAGNLALPRGAEKVRNQKRVARTRSGRILRSAIQAVVAGKHAGDLGALEDYIALEGLKAVWLNQYKP